MSDIELAQETSRKIERHFPSISASVTPLLLYAAFNLGSARVAQSMVRWLEQPGGYDQMCQQLADEGFDVYEATVLQLSARSVVTALDLCAAALFRIGGGNLGPEREAAVNTWKNGSPSHIALPLSLNQWVAAFHGPTMLMWDLLVDCRHRAAHRRFVRHITLNVGAERKPNAQVEYAGVSYATDWLIDEFTLFGQRQFVDLCGRIQIEYP